ncbi:hypothetical protein V7O66_01540 [Methanolobus sp. ZRKC3]|uniref:hypothetical protein n=1 Tax=Methanolobus sp. ZRKC3 TaxID=3125786 RepID=UPI00324B872A
MAIIPKISGAFSIKAKALLFALLIILVLILHYPMSFNEIGWDSFGIHLLANSLSELGYAKWWISTLSVFGMYPYSISSAVPFLLSSISQTTGIEMDFSIFLVSILLGLLSIFTSYMMASAIFKDEIYKFLVAFTYATSQGVLFYTTWTAGTRALFIVLLPLFIYLLLSSLKSIKYTTLTIFMFLLLTATHKMYYFIFPLIASFLLVSFCQKIKTNKLKEETNILLSILLCFGFLITLLIPFFTRTFMQSTSRYESIIMMIFGYIRYNGIAIVFIIGGYAYTILKSNKNNSEWFILLSLMLLAPLFYIVTYMKWFILSFFAIFAGIGIKNLINTNNGSKIIPIVLIIFIIFTGYYQFMHFSDTSQPNERSLNEPIYFAGFWSKNHISPQYNMVSHNSYTGERVASVSKIPTMIGTEVVDYTYGFVDESILKDINRLPLTSLKTYFDSPYIIQNTSVKTSWYIENTFRYRTIEIAMPVISELNLSYMIEDNKRGTSIFLNSLSETSDKYYDNGRICIWALNKQEGKKTWN